MNLAVITESKGQIEWQK